MTRGRAWVGVDLDGTLAKYEGWQGVDHIGQPLQPMLERVKQTLALGTEVRIFTARVSSLAEPAERVRAMVAIENWCLRHIGWKLTVTAEKDFDLVEIWDDRAVQVRFNTGEFVVQ